MISRTCDNSITSAWWIAEDERKYFITSCKMYPLTCQLRITHNVLQSSGVLITKCLCFISLLSYMSTVSRRHLWGKSPSWFWWIDTVIFCMIYRVTFQADTSNEMTLPLIFILTGWVQPSSSDWSQLKTAILWRSYMIQGAGPGFSFGGGGGAQKIMCGHAIPYGRGPS